MCTPTTPGRGAPWDLWAHCGDTLSLLPQIPASGAMQLLPGLSGPRAMASGPPVILTRVPPAPGQWALIPLISDRCPSQRPPSAPAGPPAPVGVSCPHWLGPCCSLALMQKQKSFPREPHKLLILSLMAPWESCACECENNCPASAPVTRIPLPHPLPPSGLR